MKYLSLIAIVIFLLMSWTVFQQDKSLTVRQQNRLLNVVKEYMTQKVLEKEPDATDIDFSNLQTETVEPGRTLKAHFAFSYIQVTADGAQDRVFRKGHFLATSSDGNDWKAQIEEIGDVKVEFIDPMVIGADTPETTDATGPKGIDTDGSPQLESREGSTVNTMTKGRPVPIPKPPEIRQPGPPKDVTETATE